MSVGTLGAGVRNVHLIGAGGVRMTALARILIENGVKITGTDWRDSPALKTLRELGASVSVGHNPDLIHGTDLVVYTPAIPADNPELLEAKKLGIRTVANGEALGQILSGKRVIAISGTHGKTTTCAMTATILMSAGRDPAWVIGAELRGGIAGGRWSKSDVAVAEADEAYGSFLHLKPAVGVVTAIDEDHLDYYGSMDELEAAFRRFMESADRLIVSADHPRAAAVAAGLSATTYGLDGPADFTAAGAETEAWGSRFTMEGVGESVDVVMKAGGLHNIQNALAAAAAATRLGVSMTEVAAGLAEFQGTSRRFEFRGRFDGADVVDDYAHLPAKVLAALSGAKRGPWSRIVAVFQPHLYSRTRSLWRSFGEALSIADVVVVTEIYGAREEPQPGVTGKLIVDGVCESAPGKTVAYAPTFTEALSFLRSAVREGDLVITLGAGDITDLAGRLAEDPGAG